MSKEAGAYIDESLDGWGSGVYSWEEGYDVVSTALARLGSDRNRLYGPSNIMEFGLHGVIIRAYDKLKRMRTMVFENKQDADETIEDCAADLANYAIYAVMIMRGLFELPAEARDDRSAASGPSGLD